MPSASTYVPPCFTAVYDPVYGVTKYVPIPGCVPPGAGDDGGSSSGSSSGSSGGSSSGSTGQVVYSDPANFYSPGPAPVQYQSTYVYGNPALSAYNASKAVYQNAISGYTRINPLEGNNIAKLALQMQAIQEYFLAQLEGRTFEAILGIPGGKGGFLTQAQLASLQPTITGNALLDKFAAPSDVQLASGGGEIIADTEEVAEDGPPYLLIGASIAAVLIGAKMLKKKKKARK